MFWGECNTKSTDKQSEHTQGTERRQMMHQNESAAQKLRFIKIAQTLPAALLVSLLLSATCKRTLGLGDFIPPKTLSVLLQVCGSTNSIEVSF